MSNLVREYEAETGLCAVGRYRIDQYDKVYEFSTSQNAYVFFKKYNMLTRAEQKKILSDTNFKKFDAWLKNRGK